MKPVTVADVARAAGVSTATVSRVLNGAPQVAPALVAKVRAASEQLGYRKNDLASALRRGRRMMIAAVVPDVVNPFFTAVIRGVEDTLGSRGYLLLLGNTDGRVDKEAAYLDQLAAQHLAGLIIAPASEQETDIGQFFGAAMPVVAIDRRPRDRGVHSVTLDNVNGAFRLVTALLRQVQRPGMIGGPLDSTTGAGRLEGFRRALEATSRTWFPEDVRTGPYSQEFGRHAARDLLADGGGLDGLFVGNNVLALGVLEALRELGRTTAEVRLASFDPIPWPTEAVHGVLILNGPTYELGQMAAEILLGHIEQGDHAPHHVQLDAGPVLFP